MNVSICEGVSRNLFLDDELTYTLLLPKSLVPEPINKNYLSHFNLLIATFLNLTPFTLFAGSLRQ
jgi:hypothetical protein